MNNSILQAQSESSSETTQFPDLTERFTEELVFAFVGPIGSGVSTSLATIEAIMRSRFNYETTIIKMSTLIEQHLDEMPCPELDPESSPRFRRIRTFQEGGNKTRKEDGEDFLAILAVEAIRADRERDSKSFKTTDDKGGKIPLSRRRVHLIDSIKNPAEYETLKLVYGSAFWLFGVLAPYEDRKQRLIGDGIKAVETDKLIEIDEHESDSFGQRVRKTFEYADFFIRNDGNKKDRLIKPCKRFCDLIFGYGVITPTFYERGMAIASNSAKSSACLSRQVGAAVFSKEQALLGVGCNDVPRFGGGLYSHESGDADNRCYAWGGQICHNDREKSVISSEIFAAIGPYLKDGTSESDVMSTLRSSRIKDLIEFSRAVHAEMEAIVAVARDGKVGIRGGYLFSTTEPCHNCARHIVASGIKQTLYIEPYPKSLALKLHSDSISNQEEVSDRCLFQQFEGVAPKRFFTLFSVNRDRKDDGRVQEIDAVSIDPVAKSPLDGFTVREEIVMQKLPISKEKAGAGGDKVNKSEIAAIPAVAVQRGSSEEA